MKHAFGSLHLRLITILLLLTLLLPVLGQIAHAEGGVLNPLPLPGGYSWSHDLLHPADYDWSDD